MRGSANLRFELGVESFYSQLKSKIGSILAKAAALRINLNVDGAPISSRAQTHTPLPRTKLSPPIQSPLLRYPLPRHPLPLVRDCDLLQLLALSLSPQRHPFSIYSLALALSAIINLTKLWGLNFVSHRPTPLLGRLA